jgi:NTE family protein
MRGVVSVSPKVAMIFNANGRAIFNDNTSTYKRTIVGDEDYDIYLNYHLPFIGINQITEVSNYVLTGLTGIRFNFLKTHFLTLKGNLFFDNNNLQDISNTRVLWGAGASYAIKSGVGPLEITGGFSDYFGNSNFTFNLGYWF